MKNIKNKILLTLAGIAIAFSGWLLQFIPHAVGGITSGQQYNATTTRSTSASGTVSYVAMLGQGTLGSIVVNQVGTAGYVRVFDATSTATSTTQTANPKAIGVTVFHPVAQVLGASDAAGTLTYDVQVYNGLVVETSSGFDGEYTVTFRK